MNNKISYRKDIDGIRAVSVIAVILFHMGYFKYGYLGVDVFFVISGFLITSILYKELKTGTLSIANFYMRRIRRILPLVLVVNTVALLLGVIVMLPYDLDNLCQSIIATNFFSNNILEFISSGDYWSIRNEYKPLMHTWSLGIEEQFYLLYPFVFVLALKSRFVFKHLLFIIIVLGLLSFYLFSTWPNDEAIFFLLPFRFFELAIGGIIGVVLIKHKDDHKKHLVLSFFLVLGAMFSFYLLNQEKCLIVFTVLLTVLHLMLYERFKTISRIILENSALVYLGKLSFSLYMWHQLILAFCRYRFVDDFTPITVAFLFGLFLLVSYLSYTYVEQPFRKSGMSNHKVILCLSLLFVLTSVPAAWIYMKGGVVRSVPELQISQGDSYRNMHLDYNTRHIHLNKQFTTKDNIKVLVIGNSFSRDWINVLLESNYKDSLEITYLPSLLQNEVAAQRMKIADLVFSFGLLKSDIEQTIINHDIDISKFWGIGVKHYGENNGQIYAMRNKSGYCDQKVHLKSGVITRNLKYSNSWDDRYIDFISMSKDAGNKVKAFDDNCRFISQDGMHFTQAGAAHFAKLMEVNQSQLSLKHIFGY